MARERVLPQALSRKPVLKVGGLARVLSLCPFLRVLSHGTAYEVPPRAGEEVCLEEVCSPEVGTEVGREEDGREEDGQEGRRRSEGDRPGPSPS